MYEKIAKLTTLALTLLLATNLCAMEDGMEERRPIKRKLTRSTRKTESKKRTVSHQSDEDTVSQSDEEAAGQLVAMWREDDLNDELNKELLALIEPQYADQSTQTDEAPLDEGTQKFLDTLVESNRGTEPFIYMSNAIKSDAVPILSHLLGDRDPTSIRILPDNQNLMHAAAQKGSFNVLQFLLERANALVTTKDSNGHIPLHCTTSEKVARLLIESDGDSVHAKKHWRANTSAFGCSKRSFGCGNGASST